MNGWEEGWDKGMVWHGRQDKTRSKGKRTGQDEERQENEKRWDETRKRTRDKTRQDVVVEMTYQRNLQVLRVEETGR